MKKEEVDYQKIAELFKEIRKEFGISQVEVMHHGMISPSTISLMEQGKRVKKDTLIRAFGALSATIKSKIMEVEMADNSSSKEEESRKINGLKSMIEEVVREAYHQVGQMPLVCKKGLEHSEYHKQLDPDEEGAIIICPACLSAEMKKILEEEGATGELLWNIMRKAQLKEFYKRTGGGESDC